MRLKTILNFRKGSWQKLSNKKKKGIWNDNKMRG